MTNTKLKQFLQTYNLTQKKFAFIIGKDVATVCQWIKGYVSIPPYVKLYIEKIEPSLREVRKLFKQMEMRNEDF